MTVAHAPTQLVFESMGRVVTVLSTVPIDVTTTEAVESASRRSSWSRRRTTST